MPQSEASSVGGQRSSYREILVSTLLIGGSSGVNVLISLLRVKAFALLLGPAGVGLLGVLQSLADLVRSAAELGINSSGVSLTPPPVATSAGSP
jgi:PST family polysaccharide transporter